MVFKNVRGIDGWYLRMRNEEMLGVSEGLKMRVDGCVDNEEVRMRIGVEKSEGRHKKEDIKKRKCKGVSRS